MLAGCVRPIYTGGGIGNWWYAWYAWLFLVFHMPTVYVGGLVPKPISCSTLPQNLSRCLERLNALSDRVHAFLAFKFRLRC